MPNMNGYELAKRLREDPALSGLLLVALTGYGQESNRRQAREAGFDYYLVKPVSLEALGELLTTLSAGPGRPTSRRSDRPDAARLKCAFWTVPATSTRTCPAADNSGKPLE